MSRCVAAIWMPRIPNIDPLAVKRARVAADSATGTDIAVNAKDPDAIAQIIEATGGGAHGVLVTAPSPPAFAQALEIVRRKGTVALIGLPPGSFPMPIIDVVLKGITVRGSIVGTRQDMREALDFYSRGQINATVSTRDLGEINAVFDEMKHGKIDGRVVITF